MCGRMNVSDQPGIEALLDELGVALGSRAFDARYNVAPTASILTLTSPGDGTMELADMHWGLTPAWAMKSGGQGPIINARAETARQKRTFKKAMGESRIVIPANGYYEWRREGKLREAWYMSPAEAPGFCFAGISTISGDGELQACVLTVAANEKMQPIHHRMPLLLDTDDVSSWLSSDDEATVDALLKPDTDSNIETTPVGSYVNNARNEGPQCIAPV